MFNMKKTATEIGIEERDNISMEKSLMVAEQIKTLFMFCGQLIPDLDILKRLVNRSDENVSRVMAMAPIIEAFGESFEVKEFEAKLHSKRSIALYNLIKVLDETEKERAEFKKLQTEKQKGREQLRSILGY